jgi:hypothetical protein
MEEWVKRIVEACPTSHRTPNVRQKSATKVTGVTSKTPTACQAWQVVKET